MPVGAVPEGWGHARLIPTFGIRSQQEQEKRATSCLLAVMHGVPEFGHALLKELDAPKAPVIETFAEVRFKDADGKTVIPDGAIVCRRGKKTWTCLVEVKTGSARLKDDQVAAYLDVAQDERLRWRADDFDADHSDSSESPVSVDRRKLRGGIRLWHFSWWRVLTEAVVQQRYRGISDPDQEWVLRELIHYLSSEASGAVGFEDMGENWVAVRKAAREGIAAQRRRRGARRCRALGAVHQLPLSSLSQELGATSPSPALATRPRRHGSMSSSEGSRRAGSCPRRCACPMRSGRSRSGRTFDLARRSSASPSTLRGKDAPRARFNWLFRQLKHAPDELLIEAAFPNARTTTVAKLGDVRDDPAALYYPPDPKREPRGFVLTQLKADGPEARPRRRLIRARNQRSDRRRSTATSCRTSRRGTPPAPKLRVEPRRTSRSRDPPPASGACMGRRRGLHHDDGRILRACIKL